MPVERTSRTPEAVLLSSYIAHNNSSCPAPILLSVPTQCPPPSPRSVHSVSGKRVIVREMRARCR